jgi:hypothetical protein
MRSKSRITSPPLQGITRNDWTDSTGPPRETQSLDSQALSETPICTISPQPARAEGSAGRLR